MSRLSPSPAPGVLFVGPVAGEPMQRNDHWPRRSAVQDREQRAAEPFNSVAITGAGLLYSSATEEMRVSRVVDASDTEYSVGDVVLAPWEAYLPIDTGVWCLRASSVRARCVETEE